MKHKHFNLLIAATALIALLAVFTSCSKNPVTPDIAVDKGSDNNGNNNNGNGTP